MKHAYLKHALPIVEREYDPPKIRLITTLVITTAFSLCSSTLPSSHRTSPLVFASQRRAPRHLRRALQQLSVRKASLLVNRQVSYGHGHKFTPISLDIGDTIEVIYSFIIPLHYFIHLHLATATNLVLLHSAATSPSGPQQNLHQWETNPTSYHSKIH